MGAPTSYAMISALEADGHMWVDASLFDIDRRIKDGDESGWRGDPSMGLFLNKGNGRYEVWGIDRAGTQYLAASHDKCDHTLIQKLIAGDWQKHDVVAEVLAANKKRAEEIDAAERDQRLEVADKIGFALRKDLGHLEGGTRRIWGYEGSAPSSPLPRKD